MSHLLQLDSVGVDLGGRPVLTDISLHLGSGEAIAIVGPNGSGKTTLLRLLATLLRPSQGSGTVLGADLRGVVERSVRISVGMITHAPALLDELTVWENLVHFCRISNRPEAVIPRALSAVGLENVADLRVDRCSFGMKRRAEIAWLLIAKPKLLLLDEARSGLDIEARSLVDSLARLTRERSGGVVAVSHDAGDLSLDFVAVHRLANGRMERVS
ncbi:MAG: ATP-binding cassette domain-containing protein [Acidimicrobiia bacterium]